MGSALLLVHSPFTGPYIWSKVAEILSARGSQVATPSLSSAVDKGENFIRHMAASINQAAAGCKPGKDIILIGHSAAGFFLPALAGAAGLEPSAYLFVDARLPGSGQTLLDDSPPAFRDRLHSLVSDGMLPPWHMWFEPGVIRKALPETKTRDRLIDELRPVPADLLRVAVDSDPGWRRVPCAFIQLSNNYWKEADQARRFGWPVIERSGRHLDPLNDPLGVTFMILELVDRFQEQHV